MMLCYKTDDRAMALRKALGVTQAKLDGFFGKEEIDYVRVLEPEESGAFTELLTVLFEQFMEESDEVYEALKKRVLEHDFKRAGTLLPATFRQALTEVDPKRKSEQVCARAFVHISFMALDKGCCWDGGGPGLRGACGGPIPTPRSPL